MSLLFPPVYSPTCLLQLQSFFFFFTVHMGSGPPLLSGGACHLRATIGILAFSKHTGAGGATPAFSGPLVYLQFTWGNAPPPLSGAQGTLPSLLCVFFFFSAACLLFSLVFSSFVFSGWGSVCPGGYADLAQGCLWEYHVSLSSAGGLQLPSRIGAGIWQHRTPPGFSI
jgi:hypothetical protein